MAAATCVETWDRLTTVSSFVTSVSLVALSVTGFAYVEQERLVLDQYYITILCLLGCCSGALLFCAEFNFRWFHRLFGFMKARAGRALSYLMIGTIVLLWAMEEGRNTATWPGYVLFFLCTVSGVLHAGSMCLLRTTDRERRMWATEGRALAAQPETADAEADPAGDDSGV